MPKVAKRYVDMDVGEILKRCEGVIRPCDVGRNQPGTGHAEEKHSLGGSGRKHVKTSKEKMLTHGTSSAPTAYHWAEQVRATTLVLNSDAGQKALEFLDSGGQSVKQVEVRYCFLAPVRAGKLLDFIGGVKGIVPLAAELGILVLEKDSVGLFIYTSYPDTVRDPNLSPDDGDFTVHYRPQDGGFAPYKQSYRVRAGGEPEEI
jgi:hypothetical protein